MQNPNRTLVSLFTFCLLAGAVLLTVTLISPPAPLPVDAPATEFSAGRAMRDLEIIAREPRPMGISEGHAKTRDYLLAQIHTIGLEPQVQQAFGLRAGTGFVVGGPVENIPVRLQGSTPEGAILLIAHYDSTPGVPGAADNGAGVVILLELLRTLQANPQLRQDVIFLFADGEEPGVLGAQAFVNQHPWFAEVSLVINVDTFVSGSPQLRKVSGSSGIWIQALACGTPSTRPGYISFPFDIAPSVRNDLVPFTEAGMRGIFIQPAASASEVHTALDLPDIVDPGSIQQAGDQLAGLVRCLGNQSTLEASLPDQTYFPILGRLAHYPVSWAIPLAALACACFLGTLAYGFCKRKLTWKGFGLGSLAFFLSLTISVAGAVFLWQGVQALHPAYGYSIVEGRTTLSGDDIYAFGFFTLSLAIIATAIALVRCKATALDLAVGALSTWILLSIAVTIKFPASSYVFTWVLLGGSLACLLALVIQDKKNAWILSRVGFMVSAIVATLLWIPWVSIGITSGALGGGAMFLGLMVALTAIWICSLIPVLDWIMEPKRWLLPASAILISAGLLVAGHFTVGRNSPPPLVNSIGYWLDAESGEASWIAFVGGTRTDARTLNQTQTAFPTEMDARQKTLLVNPIRRSYTDIFSQAPPFSVLTSAAPVLELDGPKLVVLSDNWVNDRRVVDIRFTTSLHDRLYIIIPDRSILAITIPENDRVELPANDGWTLRFDGMPDKPIEIRFEFAGTDAIQVLLVEESTGLPSFPGLVTQPQPGTMSSPGEFFQGMPTDFSAIYRSIKLPATGSE